MTTDVDLGPAAVTDLIDRLTQLDAHQLAKVARCCLGCEYLVSDDPAAAAVFAAFARLITVAAATRQTTPMAAPPRERATDE